MDGTTPRIRFDRNELAGAFGDIGTDLPLLTGMILAAGLDSASVFIVFGLLQVLTGLLYGIPMPVQPLKAVAALVIAQKIAGPVIFGAGLSIGIVMLVLTTTGLLGRLASIIPKSVVRGIQFGLGLTLCLLALKNYVLSDGIRGDILAGVCSVIVLWLMGNRKYPPSLFVIGLGVLYALFFNIHPGDLAQGCGFSTPRFFAPSGHDIAQGFLLLALAQIPLSLANSIFATKQVAADLFPEKRVTVTKIGLTYSLMNLLAPFFSAAPVCHGSGGMVGHYTFGARTGGSVVIYGLIYLIIGFLFSSGMGTVTQLFPLPVLGVILFFEGLALLRLIADIADSKSQLYIALLVGVLAAGVQYGFFIGMIVGTVLAMLSRKYDLVKS
jgi:hypothetical protein